ncbi:MAG: hypothetical protein HY673_00380, partial [Chloroflexi bacterium]|nr:hypothetical protein [Chloroflexota bacterium]
MEFNLKLDLLPNTRGKSPCIPLLRKGEEPKSLLLRKGEALKAARCTIIALLVVAWLFRAPAMVGAQVPSLPQYFYGALKINGSAAPAGTPVEARAPGVLTGPFNPIVTTEAGKYGDASPSTAVPRLLVQGNILDGATIEFFVNGSKAGQTGVWRSGQISMLDLTVTTVPPQPVAQVGLSQGQDTMVYVAARIVRFFDGGSGGTISLPEGIGAYDSYLAYDAAGITAKSAAGMA